MRGVPSRIDAAKLPLLFVRGVVVRPLVGVSLRRRYRRPQLV